MAAAEKSPVSVAALRKLSLRLLLTASAGILLAFLFFSDQFRSSFAGGPGVVARTLATIFTEWSTQWMIFTGLGIYFAALVFLRIRRPATSPPESSKPATIFWLTGMLAIGAIQYALGGTTAIPALVLLGGAVISQAVAVGMASQTSSRQLNLGGTLVGWLILLLTVAAIWHPAAAQSYFYRLHERWSGPWNNPNAFGLLMGTGVILATGTALGLWQAGRRSGIWRRPLALLCLTTNLPLGAGLLHSYSRGAWAATALGGIYLLWQWPGWRAAKPESPEPLPAKHWLARGLEGLGKHRLPLTVLFLAGSILCFWHFRQTDWHLARRAYSVVNAADFSWRNRITAWQGALQITAEHPWLGAGWNQPKPLYEHYYLPPKLEESAAIEMNDFLLLGATLGFPALLCFAFYLWQTLTGYVPGIPSSSGNAAAVSPAGLCLAATCRAGAVALLVGFWFDGGLFRLPTAALFWLLLGLGSSWSRPPQSDDNQSSPSRLLPIQVRGPLLGGLLLLATLFWARAQDPFVRHWFTLKPPGLPACNCVAVLPRPVSPGPVVIYIPDANDDLMSIGADLRQLAELGLAVVSLEYNQTNAAAFTSQFETALHYLERQPWVAPHTVAWMGSGLGADRILEFQRQHPEFQPQLLVLLHAGELAEPRSPPPMTASTNATASRSDPASGIVPATLLVYGGKDATAVAKAGQWAAARQVSGAEIELTTIPNVLPDLQPERKVVFRNVGEYCRSHLMGDTAWSHYRSLAQESATAPALWKFWLPPLAFAAGLLIWRCIRISRTEKMRPQPSHKRPAPGYSATVLCWLAALLTVLALAETGIHLITPKCPTTPASLAMARRFLIAPEARADLEALTPMANWQGRPLGTLLNYVTLSGYNRQLVKWPVADTLYQNYVLPPNLTPNETGSYAATDLDWRRPLWEEFYPRIRRASTPAAAAEIVVRHLRERLTVTHLSQLPQDISGIWQRQITDPAGFDLIAVAALRSVGVPAKLDSRRQAQFYDGSQWQPVPHPAILTWLR